MVAVGRQEIPKVFFYYYYYYFLSFSRLKVAE